MRQRRVKNLEKKYEKYRNLIIYGDEAEEICWKDIMRRAGSSSAALEIGCGKGKFTAEFASLHPDILLIAVEGNRSVMLRAMEKVAEAGLDNVIFIPEFISDITRWFDAGDVNLIFLNFSDPLPKARTAKHRLTHRSKLRQYFQVLPEDGRLFFKTDNDALFEFTVGEVMAENLEISCLTRDLHGGDYACCNIMTEYEEKFSAMGERINFMVVKRSEEEMNIPESMAAMNGRMIPIEDKIFGINGRAKKMSLEKGEGAVINATIGTLLGDEGELIVLSSVDEMVKTLAPSEYAAYAPIAGLGGFKGAVLKAVFGSYMPRGHMGVVASPGGTGAIRNVIANYSCLGDKILTHDWHWGPYNSIAGEQGRGVETFAMFDNEGNFDIGSFEYKVNKLLRNQERLVVIINTPANNPTGYSLSDENWHGVVKVLNAADECRKIALVVDAAYIDFAGEKDEVRTFIPILEDLNPNVLPIFAYSASKTFTFYGFRCGAAICIAPSREIADEFERVLAYSSRASWSNSPRAPQAVIEKIYADSKLLARVDHERKVFRDMLAARGRAFEKAAEEAGLEMLPFRAGFFVTIPCKDPDAVEKELENDGVFLVPFNGRGLRVSVASISEKCCRSLPSVIKAAIIRAEGE